MGAYSNKYGILNIEQDVSEVLLVLSSCINHIWICTSYVDSPIIAIHGCIENYMKICLAWFRLKLI